jgi:hypothetical protein
MDDKLKNHRMDFYDVFIFENLWIIVVVFSILILSVVH